MQSGPHADVEGDPQKKDPPDAETVSAAKKGGSCHKRGITRGKHRFTKKSKTSYLEQDDPSNPPPECVDFNPISPEKLNKHLVYCTENLLDNKKVICRAEAVDPDRKDPTWDGSKELGRLLNKGKEFNEQMGDKASQVLRDITYTRNNREENEELENFFKENVHPPLFPSQVDAAVTVAKLLKKHKAAMLTMQMGAGKTATAAATYLRLKAEGKVVRLVVVGTDMVLLSWEVELLRLNVTTVDKMKRLSLTEFRDPYAITEILDDNVPEVFFVTNATFSDEQSARGLNMLFSTAAHGTSSRTLVMIDEIHQLFRKVDTNPGFTLGKVTISKRLYIIGISGSPLINHTDEAANLLSHLAVQTHIHAQHSDVPNPCKCRESCKGQRLTRRLDPERDLTHHEAKLILRELSVFGEPVQHRLQPGVDYVVAKSGNHEAAMRISRGRQGYMGAVLAGHGLNPLEFTKTELAMKIAVEALHQDPSSGKMILLNNKHAVDVIAQRMRYLTGKNRVIALHGGVNEDMKKVLLRRLMTEDGLVLVATLDIIREGVNLQRFRLCVLCQEPWSREELGQIIARMQRIGQEGYVQVLSIVCKDDNAHERVGELQAQKVGNSEAYYNEAKEIRRQKKIHEWLVANLNPIEEHEIGPMIAGLRKMGEHGRSFPGRCFIPHAVSRLKPTFTKTGFEEVRRILKPKLSREEMQALRVRYLEEKAEIARRRAEEAAAAAREAEEAKTKPLSDDEKSGDERPAGGGAEPGSGDERDARPPVSYEDIFGTESESEPPDSGDGSAEDDDADGDDGDEGDGGDDDVGDDGDVGGEDEDDDDGGGEDDGDGGGD